ncbi:PAS domain-containing protein [Microbaculum marinum]|uniref:PAS domain-containing protein n=1 Tax=Microbaculum marinum TaxID=1764581 RepID=A0AAW9S4L1_9HYPH
MRDGYVYRGERHGERLKHTACRTLYAYWDLLRAGRPAPPRADVEPAEIGRILSDTFILEVPDAATFAYRLAGTRVCACFGRELKGENWLAAWTNRDRETLATLMLSIVRDGASAAIEFTGTNAHGQATPFETLLLPLKHRGPGYTRILGATVPLDDPYWLGAHPLTDLALTRLRLIWSHDGTDMIGSDPVRDLRHLLPLRRRKHLALYDGGVSD